MLYINENYWALFFLTGLTLICIIISVAFFTLAERRVLASIQRRKGPNITGIFGLLQPFADALKLIIKEIILPKRANKFIFLLSPFLTLYFSFIGWAVIPFSSRSFIINLNIGVLYLLIISAFSVYGILLSGWASNSKYAFLAAIRSVAQAISYEVSIALVILPVVLMSETLNLINIVLIQQKIVWFCFPLFPLCIVFFISILAETNRTPFDLAEAEAELVAGYNIEYSGILFAAFFLGEYSNILLMSSFFVILFFGGWDIPKVIFSIGGHDLLFISVAPEFIFSIKVVFIAVWFVFIRANVPRYRFDQLMLIGWKVFLPFSLGFLFFTVGLIKTFIITV